MVLEGGSNHPPPNGHPKLQNIRCQGCWNCQQCRGALPGHPNHQERVATGQLASSVNRMLPDALETGKLEIVSNAVVREITTDRNTGLADGAIFIDRRSKQEFQARARG